MKNTAPYAAPEFTSQWGSKHLYLYCGFLITLLTVVYLITLLSVPGYTLSINGQLLV
jgi:hypothetical protein